MRYRHHFMPASLAQFGHRDLGFEGGRKKGGDEPQLVRHKSERVGMRLKQGLAAGQGQLQWQ
jgi:hypothetical protein